MELGDFLTHAFRKYRESRSCREELTFQARLVEQRHADLRHVAALCIVQARMEVEQDTCPVCLESFTGYPSAKLAPWDCRHAICGACSIAMLDSAASLVAVISHATAEPSTGARRDVLMLSFESYRCPLCRALPELDVPHDRLAHSLRQWVELAAPQQRFVPESLPRLVPDPLDDRQRLRLLGWSVNDGPRAPDRERVQRDARSLAEAYSTVFSLQPGTAENLFMQAFASYRQAYSRPRRPALVAQLVFDGAPNEPTASEPAASEPAASEPAATEATLEAMAVAAAAESPNLDALVHRFRQLVQLGEDVQIGDVTGSAEEEENEDGAGEDEDTPEAAADAVPLESIALIAAALTRLTEARR